MMALEIMLLTDLGYWLKESPKSPWMAFFAENQKLLRHRLIRTELFCITLVNFLHGRGVGHTVRHFTGDGRDRVGRHQPGQKEIEEYCNDKSNKKPDYFFFQNIYGSLSCYFSPLA